MVDPVLLVVDDEPHVVRLCQRILEKNGFQVLTATSPSQALAILSRTVVDLLLLDIRMPGLDGFQLLKIARQHQPEVAAVIMTGFGTVETAISALRQGANSLILKPFDVAELVQTVQRALQEAEHHRDLLRLQALQPLLSISQSLFSETDPDHLVDLIIRAVTSQLKCSVAGLNYLKRDSREFITNASHQLDEHPENKLILQDFLHLALEKGKPFWVQKENTIEQKESAFLEAFGLSSVITVQTGGAHGDYVILAARSLEQAPFRDGDLELLTILSRQAALAMENARLYEELRSYVRQVEKSQHLLIQAEKIASAGRLTASIAHEINNPLQSLSNCLHLVGRDDLGMIERQYYLEMAQNELERLICTVQRMLDFYRPGARERKLEDINQLVQKVLELMGSQLMKSGVNVEVKLAEALPMVMVVADQIRQVLLNLIINAMEAMPEGGELFIRTAASVLIGRAGVYQRSGVEIVIEDTGPGVPESERDRIFEPFVSTKEHGTGLGLSVSYGIITAHGGSMELIRGNGKGACFRIALPEENTYESQDNGRG